MTGYRRPLNDHDLWDLNKDNTANQAVSKFQKKWQKQLRAHPKYDDLLPVEFKSIETQDPIDHITFLLSSSN